MIDLLLDVYGETFQSTHPRRVRPAHPCRYLIRSVVSIHAPTKGATGLPAVTKPSTEVSIHAPTKGATGTPLPLLNTQRGFNPRTHEGCDLHPDCHRWARRSFNPRTHEGCDLTRHPKITFFKMFQSTHPRRVRPPSATWAALLSLFQSTHPRRVRQQADCRACAVGVSIHAPTKGATCTNGATEP